MIVTLTPNPSVDRTIEVDALHRGACSGPGPPGSTPEARASTSPGPGRQRPPDQGGAAGRRLGGGAAGRPAGPLDVPVVVVPVAGSVRANVSVVEPDGTVTKLNEPGPRLSEEEIEAVTAATVKAAADAEWLACTGSLPRAPDRLLRPGGRAPGLGPGQGGGRLQRAPLVAALDAGPDLIKPNREELAEATGRSITTLGDVVAAAEELRARGVGAVLASLGADGAVLVDATGATFGSATVDKPRSAVGAGDSMLAGFLAGGGSGPAALAEALAWGRARPACPAAACRPPTTSTATPSPSPTASTRPPSQGTEPTPMADLITPDLVDLNLTQTERGEATRPGRAAPGGRPGHRPRAVPGRRPRPRGPDADRHRGRHRHPALPLGGRHRAHAWASAAAPRASTGAPPTGRPTSSS